MAFGLIKEIPHNKIVDKERGIALQKTEGYGRQFSIFDMKIGQVSFEFTLQEIISATGTTWKVHKIDYPQDSEFDQYELHKIVKEAVEAYLDLQFFSVRKNHHFDFMP